MFPVSINQKQVQLAGLTGESNRKMNEEDALIEEQAFMENLTKAELRESQALCSSMRVKLQYYGDEVARLRRETGRTLDLMQSVPPKKPFNCFQALNCSSSGCCARRADGVDFILCRCSAIGDMALLQCFKRRSSFHRMYPKRRGNKFVMLSQESTSYRVSFGASKIIRKNNLTGYMSYRWHGMQYLRWFHSIPRSGNTTDSPVLGFRGPSCGGRLCAELFNIHFFVMNPCQRIWTERYRTLWNKILSAIEYVHVQLEISVE